MFVRNENALTVGYSKPQAAERIQGCTAAFAHIDQKVLSLVQNQAQLPEEPEYSVVNNAIKNDILLNCGCTGASMQNTAFDETLLPTAIKNRPHCCGP